MTHMHVGLCLITGCIQGVLCFLETYKKECTSCKDSNFWDVSRVLLEKIEGQSYLNDKKKHNQYLKENPYVAKYRGINIYGS